MYKQHKYDAAVSALDLAIADMGADQVPDAKARAEALGGLYYHLGAAHYGRKNKELARRALQSALGYAPDQKEATALLEAIKRDAPSESSVGPVKQP